MQNIMKASTESENSNGQVILPYIKWTVNKSHKSFVGKIWEAESTVSGDEGPQKSWGNKIGVR